MAWLKKSEAGRGPESLDEDEEARAGLINPDAVKSAPSLSEKSRSLSNSSLVAALILTNIAWAAVCLILWRGSTCAVSHISRFNADFVSLEPIPYKMVDIEFDDLLKYNETSHEVYRQMDSTLPRYFGKPDPSIDQAWAQLLQYEYPAISAKEKDLNPTLSFQQKDQHPVTGKHYFALDAFHGLHCLNMIRMELDKDYYGAHHHGGVGGRARTEHNYESMQSSFDAAQRDHIDHCMNHIRQSLQCRPDLSAAAMHVFEDNDGSEFFLGNAKRHTCYDWNSILEWASARKTDLGYATPIE